ncbi:unnamed protein product [Mesocestoides corti]|uniref:Uncharacterized protein n=1 Tax=Mesocestoides corti TaxID=53468 RepID=A0A158QSC2_MESCO|nr:unnamed protein product [Mesocestoides corti]
MFGSIRLLQVLFLGGACNPTTWRQEKAIPVLEQEKIPYYNPQVEEWSPELIALEREAKERSFLLLFVFDPNLTRGLASLVEVAYLAALGRRLVIVRPNIKKLRVMATGNRISRIEAKCIAEAFQWLDGIRLPNVSVFDTLEEALIYLKLQYLAQIRLLEAYKFLPSLPLVISDFTPDVYCGGDTQFCENGHSNKTWVIPRRTRRSFKLTLSIQSLCREFYFYISKDNLWLVDQMEVRNSTNPNLAIVISGATDCIFAIFQDVELQAELDEGSAQTQRELAAAQETGDQVRAFTRKLTSQDCPLELRMEVLPHAPYSSDLINKQDDVRKFVDDDNGIPTLPQRDGVRSDEDESSLSLLQAAFAIGSGKKVTLCIEYLSDDTRSQNSSGYSSLASTPQDTFQPPPTSANTDLPCVLPTHPPYPHLACPANLALSPTAIKDHNRSRAYLKSLAEETNNAVLGHPLRGLRDLM